MLVLRDAFDAVGGWDERYWFYAEDVDLCLRVRRTGRRVRYVGTASATHVKGASSKLRTRRSSLPARERSNRRRVERAIVESHWLFFREHLERTTARPISWMIRVMFAAQRVRLRLTARLDAFRGL